MSIFVDSFVHEGFTVSDETLDDCEDRFAYLGSGISRRVYVLSDKLVLKIADRGWNRCNIKEANSWECAASNPDLSKYLAAVVACSPSGRWLVMERAEQTYSRYSGPSDTNDAKREAVNVLEHFGATDLHDGNLGVFSDGVTVRAIDYGFGKLDEDSSLGFHGDNGRNHNEPPMTSNCGCDSVHCDNENCNAVGMENHIMDCNQCVCSICGGHGDDCTNEVCIIANNERYCEAGISHDCVSRLYEFADVNGERMVFCRGHLPDVGPIPEWNHKHAPLFREWQIECCRTLGTQWNTKALKRERLAKFRNARLDRSHAAFRGRMVIRNAGY